MNFLVSGSESRPLITPASVALPAGVVVLTGPSLLTVGSLGALLSAATSHWRLGRTVVFDMRGCALALPSCARAMKVAEQQPADVAIGPSAVVLPVMPRALRAEFGAWALGLAALGITRALFERDQMPAALEWAADEAAISRACDRAGRPRPGFRPG